MASDSHRLMRGGMIAVLIAVGLIALGGFLPHFEGGWVLLMHMAHLLFIGGCAVCWQATPDRRVRRLVAASTMLMGLAWFSGFYLIRHTDFPFEWMIMARGLRWIACGMFAWFVMARENALAGFTVAGGTVKLAYAVMALGVFIMIGGYFHFIDPFSRTEPIGFLLVLGLLAAIIGTRLSGSLPAGGLREFGAVPNDPLNPGITDDDPWRARLLESIRDCGVQRAPRDRVFQWVITISVVAAIIIITMIGRRVIASGMYSSPPAARATVLLLWMAFNLFVLVRIRNKFLRKAWQTSAASAEEELQRAGSRRPILYLRSFQLDDRIGRPGWIERFFGSVPLENAEQMLTKTLRKTGPVIAIGRPEEKLPALGAARFYVSHDRWQDKVRDVADESQLIVWATGITEGLRWEVSHLLKSVPPERLLLWAHPHLLRVGPEEREAEWKRFQEKLGDEFPKSLPEKLGDARFITFGPDWEPRPVAPPHNNLRWSLRSLFGPQRSALRAILAVRRGEVSRRWITPWREGLGTTGAWLLLAATVAILSSMFFGDGTYTVIHEGQPDFTNSIRLSRGSQIFRLEVTLALAALVLSMLWGRSILWQRVRAAAILGLAIFACMVGVFVLREMAEQMSPIVEQTWNSTTGETVEREVVHYDNGIALGGYLNFALSGLVAFLAAKNAKAVWRRKASDFTVPTPIPLREEDILYHGPTQNPSFVQVIGAAGPMIDWRRASGFFAACVALRAASILGYGSFVGPLLWALATTAAAIAAFRFINRPLLAALVAAAGSALVTVVIFRQGDLLETFLANAALLAALALATPRLAPLGFALSVAALIGGAARLIAYAIASGDLPSASSFVLTILGAAMFAGCLVFVVQRRPSQTQAISEAI